LENVSVELTAKKFLDKIAFWTNIGKEVVVEEELFRNQIKELKSFLNEIDGPVNPSQIFKAALS
jgi:hypothetical protein